MRLYTQRCPSLALLLVLVVHAAQGTFITNDTSDLSLSTYEYIVIGGGTVGLAVANRLAVNHSVLVVERGPDLSDSDVINNPFTPFGTPSPCHFSMAGAPQVGSNGVRSLPLTYGSCLGGGSSINAMMGARPTFAGMGAVEALGNPGWGWDDFLPYMQRSETFTPPDPTQLAEGANYIAAVHGFDGPVGVSFARPFVAPEMQDAAKTTVQSAFDNLVALTRDMGDGFSGGHVASFYHHIHFNETVQADRRSSSAWSFLYPQAQQRAGLTVLTGYRVNSLVTLKKRGGEVTATGVLVQPTIGGGTIVFNISKEVVISSGALYSPAILQRSGIGNATYLKSLQIEPVLDLPSVGANFQDQILLTNVSFPLAASANNTNVTGGADVLLGIVVSHPTARDALGTDGAAAIDASCKRALTLDAYIDTYLYHDYIETP
ncbi:hypothetical protein D9757_013287 [Collybiopsis confluens]|uniref:Glucose-methanol-choline oxidoreductase N-terminal domain-containing protein n=1 Tax=Collybiopsis confluens TaxID=2823264 RepID=A0A8H5G678_9AGAR|nr:hypothetical protein D9757_013287 [Collybiopsis confluens]